MPVFINKDTPSAAMRVVLVKWTSINYDEVLFAVSKTNNRLPVYDYNNESPIVQLLSWSSFQNMIKAWNFPHL